MTQRELFSILTKTETPDEPDVLLFSSLDPSVLVAGTYHIKEDGRRSGSLLVYSVDPSSFAWYGFEGRYANFDSQLKQIVRCSAAVLDASW